MINESHVEKLENLCGVFLEENSKLNLSAFRDHDACWVGNILDSIASLELDLLKNLPEGSRIADAGTGGGFPFLPLALCMENHSFTGLDSTAKKLDAINRIANTCDIRNAVTHCGRLEEVGHDSQYREQFDVVTARALAPLNVLIEYCTPLLKPNGFLLAWKSMNTEEELRDALPACSELSCHRIGKHEYELPGDWGRRQILIFQKSALTPKKYPRQTGLPKKHPIGSEQHG